MFWETQLNSILVKNFAFGTKFGYPFAYWTNNWNQLFTGYVTLFFIPLWGIESYHNAEDQTSHSTCTPILQRLGAELLQFLHSTLSQSSRLHDLIDFEHSTHLRCCATFLQAVNCRKRLNTIRITQRRKKRYRGQWKTGKQHGPEQAAARGVRLQFEN